MSSDWDIARTTVGTLSIWIGTTALFAPRWIAGSLGVRPDAARDDVALPLLVDVVGLTTGLLAQLWLTGALTDVPGGGRVRTAGALPRGTATALRAVRVSPAAVLAGVVLGGGVSALVTLPPSVAALGFDGVLGPLDAPSAAAFTVATVSDVVASWLTLPFLALVLVLAAGSTRQFAGKGRA